ncbi:MAG: hypothetical protein H6Q90_5734 [Deltaproteobacteria bacterium]|nr:hypothetical protein [Deltaproteobacteria bacterium]
MRIIPALLTSAALTAGCIGSGEYRVTAVAYTPDLVEISPGVSVIVDYDEPIFYSNNYYWRNDGGRWYRSNYYNRGWVYANPPVVVGRINTPGAYRHYRPHGYVARENRGNRAPVRRDHRR